MSIHSTFTPHNVETRHGVSSKTGFIPDKAVKKIIKHELCLKKVINDKNIKRRRESMLRGVTKSIGYIFILALFLASVKAWAGHVIPFFDIGVAQNFGIIPDTDFAGGFQVYFPYDKRNRQSFIQVTNIRSSDRFIHVQVFNDNSEDCNENSFWDTLTGKDTNVYDLDDPFVQADPDAFGFVVVTVVTGIGSTEIFIDDMLIGNFRIIDDAGFEYRSNSAAIFFTGKNPDLITDVYTFNFNDVENADQSDVFGIAVDNALTGNVDAGGAIAAIFAGNIFTGDEFFTYDSILEFNDAEIPFDCDALAFICGDPNETLFDVLQILGLDIPSNRIAFEFGINPALPSVTAEENICDAPFGTGFVVMPLTLIVSGLFSADDIANADNNIDGESQAFFVGYTGLNDGDGTGSMDTWWAKPPRIFENND